MARPKQFKSAARLNLVMEARIKKEGEKLAFDRRISLSRLVENLIAAEKARTDLAAANGAEVAR